MVIELVCSLCGGHVDHWLVRVDPPLDTYRCQRCRAFRQVPPTVQRQVVNMTPGTPALPDASRN